MTNGIRELDLASIRQAGCDDILCDPAPHVRRAAVHFARVFPGKSATAVPPHSAIRIANNLAARYPCIAFRTADDKSASWIDQVGRLFIQPFCRHHFLDEKFR